MEKLEMTVAAVSDQNGPDKKTKAYEHVVFTLAKPGTSGFTAEVRMNITDESEWGKIKEGDKYELELTAKEAEEKK